MTATVSINVRLPGMTSRGDELSGKSFFRISSKDRGEGREPEKPIGIPW